MGKPVYLPTEIQHGLYDGGGGAGLQDHWNAIRWLGQGPYRVWKNRLAGQEVAVHYKTANFTDTGKQLDTSQE